MGYYKVMAECIHQNNPILPEIVIMLAQISPMTATPLYCWQSASRL